MQKQKSNNTQVIHPREYPKIIFSKDPAQYNLATYELLHQNEKNENFYLIERYNKIYQKMKAVFSLCSPNPSDVDLKKPFATWLFSYLFYWQARGILFDEDVNRKLDR